MAINLLMQVFHGLKEMTMDETGGIVFLEKGEKVRLTQDYGEFKKGRIGEFIQYVGNDGLTLVEIRGNVHLSVWAVDLEKVPVRKVKEVWVVAAQPIKNFANGDKVVLVDQTPTDDKYFILQPGTEVLIRAQDQQKNCTRVEGHCFDGTDQYLLIDNLIDNETLVVPLEEA